MQCHSNPTAGLAAVYSICSHISWCVFRCLPWSHLQNIVYLKIIVFTTYGRLSFYHSHPNDDWLFLITIKYCFSNLNSVNFNTMNGSFQFVSQLYNKSWLLDASNVALSDRSWLYFYYKYYRRKNNEFTTYPHSASPCKSRTCVRYGTVLYRTGSDLK